MWIINDLNVANRVYEYISPEALSSLYERCEKYADFEYIYVAKGDTEFLRVCKSVFGWIDYEPDEWNPFPQNRPPKNGPYLVTVKPDYGANRVIPCRYNRAVGWINIGNKDVVLAFREYPKPYLEEDGEHHTDTH